MTERTIITSATDLLTRYAAGERDFCQAHLSDADLSWADLSGADLSGADLRGADLSEADLSWADLRGADLSEADLSWADLRGADLSQAHLSWADLRGADLRWANLSDIRADVEAVLAAAPHEAAGLLAALREGRVDGSVYNGECACLVGTIAHLRGCSYEAIPGLEPDSSRPAERWALAIRQGDTPETNQVAALTAEWIAAWLEARSVETAQKELQP